MTAYDKYQRDIGRQENQIQIALRMLERDYDMEIISELTGLDPNFILEEERKAREGAKP